MNLKHHSSECVNFTCFNFITLEIILKQLKSPSLTSWLTFFIIIFLPLFFEQVILTNVETDLIKNLKKQKQKKTFTYSMHSWGYIYSGNKVSQKCSLYSDW